MLRCVFVFLLCLSASLRCAAQADSASIPFSENGWYLSPHGTIRVLVLFCEIEYDKEPGKNPQPGGADHWPLGQLPKWKDEVFDPFTSPSPKAMVTRYYHDISLGRYVVLGDYIDQELVLKESEYPEVRAAHSVGTVAVKEANKLGALRTHHGLTIADFDMWRDGGKQGLPKENTPDDPHKYDHVMVIVRNSGLTHGQGSTDSGSPGRLFGHDSDSQSRFGGMYALPFEILKHEYNHLLLGGNNFHSGGGNAAKFESCFIPLQGGWSMMGAASSSLLTCTGWDRDRLGWRPQGAPHRINATDAQGRWIDGDLDPLSADTGVFFLRDFVTTGDVLRIKLPHLGTKEMGQWLWLENHLGHARNGSPTDRFHYEEEQPCVQGIVPGVFAMLQVEHEEKRGTSIFSGSADYLRALPAGGLFDPVPRGDTVAYTCLWGGRTPPMLRDARLGNGLTGASDLEIPLRDANADGVLDRSKEGYMTRIEVKDGRASETHRFFGHPDQAFTPEGDAYLGMGSNPALTNAITLVGGPRNDKHKSAGPNNRVVHLAGISVRLEQRLPDGTMRLRVRSDDTRLESDVRWCADSIVLHAVDGHEGYALFVAENRTLTIDRSGNASRIERPQSVSGEVFFNSPTRLTVLAGARVRLAAGARLLVEEASDVHFMPGSLLSLAPGAALTIEAGSRIVLHGAAQLDATRKQRRKLERKKRIVRVP